MRRSILMTSVWAAGAVLVACDTGDVQHRREALLQADRAFAAATAHDRIEGWVRYFASDGAMMQGGQLIRGPAAVRTFMTPAFADSTFRLTWHPTTADVSASGDLGYTVGRWEIRRDAGRQEHVTTGSYVTLWKRQADGSWKVVLDTGSSDE